MSVDVETKLRDNGEPYVVWSNSEVQILLEGADNAINEAVAVRHDGCQLFALEAPERRVEDCLFGFSRARRHIIAPDISLPCFHERAVEGRL